jgi:hypothetical protein
LIIGIVAAAEVYDILAKTWWTAAQVITARTNLAPPLGLDAFMPLVGFDGTNLEGVVLEFEATGKERAFSFSGRGDGALLWE